MQLSPSQLQLLDALEHGPRSLQELIQSTELPDFTARAELGVLSTRGAVQALADLWPFYYELTPAGCRVLYETRQLTL